MRIAISRWLISLITLLMLDAGWIYFFMGQFFTSQVGHLVRDQMGWGGALAAYLVLHTCLYYFVISRSEEQSSAPMCLDSALLGLGLFGVYELTNYATLQGWPLQLVIVDSAWGAVLCVLVAGFTRLLTHAVDELKQ